MDGGSTDGAADIIRKYSPWLDYWTSAPDRGQVAAINAGMARTSGALLNWINSDDFLLPGALAALGSIMALACPSALISGGRHLRCAQTGVETIQLQWPSAWPMYLLGFPDFPQDATFFTRGLWETCGPLDDRFNYMFDVAFFARAVREARKMLLTSAPLSVMQVHPDQKTTTHDERKAIETSILKHEYFVTSPWRRVVWRLLHTRFHRELRLLAGLCSIGGAMRCRVAEFDHASLQWRTSPLS